MSILLPSATTVGDLCTEALRECGAFGIGQNPLADDINGAWARLQWMLQMWERKRFLVYQLVTYLKVSTGALSYTIGPGGDIDTGAGTARPDKIEMGFLRQLVQSQPNQIDYPMTLLQAMEDYSKIAIKGLQSFPQYVFYDPGWPLGHLYFWPVPQASIYSVAAVVKQQLPTSFASLATVISLPFEYYSAILYNLALRLRSKYQIPTYPGDELSSLAKDSLLALRDANTAIAALSMPADLNRPGIYNIFSDRFY